MVENLSPATDQNPNGKDAAVFLPCSIDVFRDFVAGLLGAPQEIEGGKFGAFAIGRPELEQTYHLITQRVAQQHGVKPLGFTIRIVYDDGTSIQLNSFQDFQSFHEPKPVISTECHIEISYLIQFPIATSPEKQDISVSFISSTVSKGARFPLATFAESSQELFARGYINYRIKYTARTWGADIEGLLKNHIEHLIEPEPPIRSFLRRHSMAIGLVTGTVTFSILFYGQSILTERATIEQIGSLASIFGRGTPLDVKLDAVIHLLVSGAATRLSELSSRFLAVGAVASIVLAFFVENAADRRKPSFVVFTKRAEEEKEIELKKYSRSWTRLWISIIGGLTIGVCSNFIYDYFAKRALTDIMTNHPFPEVHK